MIFMMIFLNSFVSLSKKKIPVSFLVVFFLFIFREIFELENASLSDGIKIIINIAGGLCGSLFAFLTSPKAKTARKSQASDTSSSEPTQEKRGGLFKRASAYDDADETVVSSIKFDD